jgi:hypothetical protein
MNKFKEVTKGFVWMPTRIRRETKIWQAYFSQTHLSIFHALMESFYPSTTAVQDFASTSFEVFAEPFQGNSPIDGTIQRLGCSHAEDNMLPGVSPFYCSRASVLTH